MPYIIGDTIQALVSIGTDLYEKGYVDYPHPVEHRSLRAGEQLYMELKPCYTSFSDKIKKYLIGYHYRSTYDGMNYFIENKHVTIHSSTIRHYIHAQLLRQSRINCFIKSRPASIY